MSKFKVGDKVKTLNSSEERTVTYVHTYTRYSITDSIYEWHEHELKEIPQPITAKEAGEIFVNAAGGITAGMQKVLDAIKKRGIA
jgi:hypothetical protein